MSDVTPEMKAAVGPIDVPLADGRIAKVREMKPTNQNRLLAAAAHIAGVGEGIAFMATFNELVCRWAVESVLAPNGKPDKRKRIPIARAGDLMDEQFFDSLSEAECKAIMAAAARPVTEDEAKN